MSWHSGTDVMRAVIVSVLKNVPDTSARKSIYEDTVKALRAQDWNDFADHDLMGLDAVYDALIAERYPETVEDDED